MLLPRSKPSRTYPLTPPFAYPYAPGSATEGDDAALITITWASPADAAAPTYDGYRIYKSTDSGATYSLLDTVGDVTTADIDATAGDMIYVAAYNDAGENPQDAAAALALGEILTIT